MTEVTAAIPGAAASHPRSLHWRRASSMGSKSRDFRGGAIVLQCRVRTSRRPRARMALTTPDPTSGVVGDSVKDGPFEGGHPDALTYPSSDARPAPPLGRKDSSSPHVGAPPWTRCSPDRPRMPDSRTSGQGRGYGRPDEIWAPGRWVGHRAGNDSADHGDRRV